MSQAITPGTLSESDARILSAKYVRERAGLPCPGGKLNPRIVIPDADADYFATQVQPSHIEVPEVETPKSLIERETWITVGFCSLAAVALALTYLNVPFLIGELFGSLR